MFCRKADYLKMEKIQHKVLKIVFNSNESFEDLLLHSNEVSIHQKQLHQLTTKIYKNPFFTVLELPYNLRNGLILNLPSAGTTYYGNNSILLRACQVWNSLPLSIKQTF